MSIVIALLIFTAIVVIHEWGHYMAARKTGVCVEEFAVGMGPKIWGVTGKKTGTLYSIRLLPIGGYCKMVGEDGNVEDEHGFNNKPKWARAIILFAGVVMNVLLAFVVFAGVNFFTSMSEPVVGGLMDGVPAQEAGLLPGDRIVKIDGTRINIYEDLQFATYEGDGKPMEITVVRDGVTYVKSVTPKLYVDPTVPDDPGTYKIGFTAVAKVGLFAPNPNNLPRAGVLETVRDGAYQIIFYIKSTFIGVEQLVTGKSNINQMSGIIGIVGVIHQGYDSQVQYAEDLTNHVSTGAMVGGIAISMLQFMAILSANLAVINLLPLPALDGGRLVFVLIEAIARKPVPREKEGMVHLVGFVLLMVFAVFIAYHDVLKLL